MSEWAPEAGTGPIPEDYCPVRAPSSPTLVRRLAPTQRRQIEGSASAWIDATRQLSRQGHNVVTALLRGATPETWQHYPHDDAQDQLNGVSYYYHCHAMRPVRPDEHGHFHIFLHETWDTPAAHLAAITVDGHGQPLRACATNRWVTGECVRPAASLIAALASLRIDTSRGRRNVDRWLTALLRLFSPQIAWLLTRRDQRIAALSDRDRGLEDRRIQIWSQCRLSITEQIGALG